MAKDVAVGLEEVVGDFAQLEDPRAARAMPIPAKPYRPPAWNRNFPSMYRHGN